MNTTGSITLEHVAGFRRPGTENSNSVDPASLEWSLRESSMIYSKESSLSPEEVGKRLEAAAARNKFGVLHVHDLKKTLESKGIQLGAECRVYDVCNPDAASRALHTDMRVSTVLPCRISVFSKNGGSLISTVKPTALFAATGLKGSEALATEVERRVLDIIDESA
ncbi:MAG: DUF302 domain-containing protein [Acidobacteriota bacterium]